MEDKWIENQHGARHLAKKPWEQAKLDKEVADHAALVQNRLNGTPLPKNPRVPLYTRHAQPPSSPMVPHAPSQNTCVGEYLSRGGLTLDILSEQRNLAERCGKFSMEVFTNDNADARLLHDAGFSLVGSLSRPENHEMVMYKRFRLVIQRSGDGVA